MYSIKPVGIGIQSNNGTTGKIFVVNQSFGAYNIKIKVDARAVIRTQLICCFVDNVISITANIYHKT